MRTDLDLLRCGRCNAPVALADATSVPCAFCNATVEIPDDHREALRTAREGQEARAKAVERLEALGEKPQPLVLWIGIATILVLPSVAVFLASRSAELGLSQLELLAYAGLPAVFPGAGLYLWAIVASGTSRRFCVALGAAPRAGENGPQRCRSCAAPLSEPEVGHLVRCAYCLCDNLLREFDLDGLQQHLRSSLQTLEQAIRLMRVRRALWGLGILFGVVIFVGLMALAAVAQQ